MSNDLNTYQQFLEAAKIELSAGREKYDIESCRTLDEKLRLGDVAGPLICKSCVANKATFTPHPTIAFDWGKLKPDGTVKAILTDEILTSRDTSPAGSLTPENAPRTLVKDKYSRDDLSLVVNQNYLFAEDFFDGDKQIIAVLSDSDQKSTWPKSLPKTARIGTAKTIDDAETRAMAACLDVANPILAIKGPPGTGKTDLLAKVALALAISGKKVGIVSTSRAAVDNALARIATFRDRDPKATTKKILKHADKGKAIPGVEMRKMDLKNTPPAIWGAVNASAVNMYPKDRGSIILEFKFGTCDVLLLDEAGQMPAHGAAALSHLAPRMILFGDEDQLPNISHGSHPPGSHGDSSAMRYLHDVLDPSFTIPLEVTHRMNETICGLIQRHFYPCIELKAGKNASAHLLENGSPFPALIKDDFHHPAPRLSRNEKEAAVVAEWVERLLTMEVKLDGKKPREMTTEDIAVLTPFRAHSAAITKAIQDAGIADADKLRIGTVDKMQGQGAAAVIYSLASSSKDYIANQAEWLFSSNRWNVAISRAQACAIVIGDLNAHFSAVPNALHGIAAQQKIWELMKDSIWHDAVNPQSL